MEEWKKGGKEDGGKEDGGKEEQGLPVFIETVELGCYFSVSGYKELIFI